MGEECSSPGRFTFGQAAGHDCWGQSTYRPTAPVHDPGLLGQGLSPGTDSNQVARSLADTTALNHHDLAVVTVNVEDVFAHPPSYRSRIDLGLNHDRSANNVQSTGEAQQRGYLGLTTTGT